jgi:multisubunit Na+/H+ antiporter MnhC subunit
MNDRVLKVITTINFIQTGINLLIIYMILH